MDQFVQFSSVLVKQFCKKVKVKIKRFHILGFKIIIIFLLLYFSEGPIFH